MRRSLVALVVVAGLALAACGQAEEQGSNTDPDQVDSVDAPELGVCRLPTPDDVA
ncbi:MAG: Septum formation, partial [Nocardioides sp.]|nr:Septum formation [Nocardioides sp.]